MIRLFLIFIALFRTEVLQLIKRDITTKQPEDSDSPFLVFLYYEKKNFHCPVCIEFEKTLDTLDITVKTLNFAKNVELGSRFLQHTFPAFILRNRNKSYVIEPRNVDELQEIIKNETWRSITPVKTIVDVNSVFSIVFSKLNVFIFFGINMFYFMMNYVPDYVVSAFILCIIVYLIYSIIDVLTTREPKQKQY